MTTEGSVRARRLVRQRVNPDIGGDSRVMSKRTLLLMSQAMERAFDTAGSTDQPGLAVSLFQRRQYFDVQAQRYADLARAGHTVLVAFPGSTDGLPDGVRAVPMHPADPRAEDWVLLLVRGGASPQRWWRPIVVSSTAPSSRSKGPAPSTRRGRSGARSRRRMPGGCSGR